MLIKRTWNFIIKMISILFIAFLFLQCNNHQKKTGFDMQAEIDIIQSDFYEINLLFVNNSDSMVTFPFIGIHEINSNFTRDNRFNDISLAFYVDSVLLKKSDLKLDVSSSINELTLITLEPNKMAKVSILTYDPNLILENLNDFETAFVEIIFRPLKEHWGKVLKNNIDEEYRAKIELKL